MKIIKPLEKLSTKRRNEYLREVRSSLISFFTERVKNTVLSDVHIINVMRHIFEDQVTYRDKDRTMQQIGVALKVAKDTKDIATYHGLGSLVRRSGCKRKTIEQLAGISITSEEYTRFQLHADLFGAGCMREDFAKIIHNNFEAKVDTLTDYVKILVADGYKTAESRSITYDSSTTYHYFCIILLV